MTDFIVRRAVREALVGPTVGNAVVSKAVRETLLGPPVGNAVIYRAVRETLVGTVPWPTTPTTAIPKRAAQIIG